MFDIVACFFVTFCVSLFAGAVWRDVWYGRRRARRAKHLEYERQRQAALDWILLVERRKFFR